MDRSSLIEVTVNGAQRRISSGRSVAQLLKELEVAPERVAVELDRSIVRKRDWDAIVVQEGSQIEIVEFVGGG